MKINFTKMHGCGNDYVYVDGAKEKIPQDRKAEIARFVSDRHFGIGSDGLIFINPWDEEDVDFEMEMYNADGSRAEMCGNGIRCVAKYVYDNHLTDKKKITIISAGKKKYLNLTVGDDSLVRSVKVDMGAPVLSAEDVPVRVDGKAPGCNEIISEAVKSGRLKNIPDDLLIGYPINVAGREWKMTCVSMGNPHAVIFLSEDESLEDFDLEHIGPQFENHPFFPNRVNTEFVKVDDRNNVHMRVWERGTGETLACGTGSCAVVTACILNGYTDNTVTVHLLGGDVTDTWNGDASSSVFMDGPATTAFSGTIELY